METPEGNMTFKQCPITSFPYADLDKQVNEGAAMLLKTMQGHYEGFTRKEVDRAKEVRWLQSMISNLSKNDYESMTKQHNKVSHSILRNYKITPDIANEKVIF